MGKTTTYSEESAVDVCIREYTSTEGLVSLCIANGLELDFSDASGGSTLQLDEALAKDLRARNPLFSEKPAPAQGASVIQSGQNLVDLSVQEMGSVEGLVALMKLNGYSFSTIPVAGELLKVTESEVINQVTRNYFRQKEKKVNTGYDGTGTAELPTGIGSMIIETNFIVG